MNKYYQHTTINEHQIYIYNQEAFNKLAQAGELAYRTLEHVGRFVKEGITTEELDQICHQYIKDHHAIPATLGYQGYPKSCCISINHEICHGIPSERKLKEGDILNIDVTVILDGFYGDTSKMFSVGQISPLADKLMQVTQQCLHESIKILSPGISINEIGCTIEKIAHNHYFSVVEDFCGHGIGHNFHQAPQILHYNCPGNNLILESGMVFTIEPMINSGKKHTKLLSNQWTAITKDFSLSAQYEHTIGITDNGYIIFTLPIK